MFKKFSIGVLLLFLISLASLVLFWQESTGLELYSEIPVVSVYRLSQDLGGKWDGYSSLREAWVGDLSHKDSIVLPSSKGFKAAVKYFKVSGKWGSMAAQLVVNGLNGRLKVYLNGIDEVNYLGEYESAGGTVSIDVTPAMFNFDGENVLYLEIMPGTAVRNKLFGRLWPDKGKITGQIRLEAVPETTIDLGASAVKYQAEDKKMIVSLALRHHQSLAYGPWSISGVLKDKGQPVAECLMPLMVNGEYQQKAELVFQLTEPKLWSIENPFLYELDLNITNSQGNIDSIQVPIGAVITENNTAKWQVNDKTLDVRAQIITLEQEYDLRNKRQIESFLTGIKGQGKNTIYFMGFFPDEEWLYAADRIGIGVWLEMPASVAAAPRVPQVADFEDLILIAERHPSVLAWTAGKGLQASTQTSEYLESVRERIPAHPVYHLDLFFLHPSSLQDDQILLRPEGLQGSWGTAEFLEDSVPATGERKLSTGQKTLAVVWAIWLALLGVQNFRATNWRYNDLFNPDPKRGIRRAFLWRSLAMFSRYAAWAGVITALLYQLPAKSIPWLPYDFTFLISIQAQPPYLIWLFLSSLFTLLRFFQAGLASMSFPQHPGTTALSCWLERRFYWGILLAISWVLLVYNNYGDWYVYLPLALYLLLVFLMLPLRIRDARKAGGKYSRLLLLPLTAVACFMILCLWNYPDLNYLWRIVQSFVR